MTASEPGPQAQPGPDDTEPRPRDQPGLDDLPPPLPPDEAREVLESGTLEVKARILPASNATFLAEATEGTRRVACVYKPVSGERPLWDFPHGTLAGREVAAYLVSQLLGWDLVPVTLLRDGPVGPGMVQQWCEPDPDVDPVDLCPRGEVPDGYLHVLDAQDERGQVVSLVHEDSEALQRMAVFDAVVNNADRKGGHVLAMPGGHRYGVDHGICFHSDDKLRTVLWGWARAPLAPDHEAALEALLGAVEHDPVHHEGLTRLLSAGEVTALLRRVRRLLTRGTMPLPSGEWPSIPWPAF